MHKEPVDFRFSTYERPQAMFIVTTNCYETMHLANDREICAQLVCRHEPSKLDPYSSFCSLLFQSHLYVNRLWLIQMIIAKFFSFFLCVAFTSLPFSPHCITITRMLCWQSKFSHNIWKVRRATTTTKKVTFCWTFDKYVRLHKI